MHFVDTMHSEAYTFTYICTHSDAFDTVRILTHSYAYRSFPLLSLFCPTVRITTHSDAFVCILMHLMADALERIRTHSYAFLCIRMQVRHEDPLQLGVLGGLLLGAISATYAIRSVFCFAYFSAFCVLRIFDPNYVLRIAYCV